VLRSPHGVGGTDGEDLADHHPIKEHAQRGQPLLHRGPGVLFHLRLDKRRHMHPLHLGEILDPVLGAESGELPHRLAVGADGGQGGGSNRGNGHREGTKLRVSDGLQGLK